MRNPLFQSVLDQMAEVHDRKNEDYADNGNPYSNFENTAQVAGIDVGTVFQVLIGIKVERLRQLTSGKDPNFESKQDTILDLANYAALWLSYERRESSRDAMVELATTSFAWDSASVQSSFPSDKAPWREEVAEAVAQVKAEAKHLGSPDIEGGVV